jgi:hypothetical protein
MKIKIFLFAALCAYLQSCTTVKTPQYVGLYQLNLAASKLGKYAAIDSIQYLKLSIRDDSTFEFSRDVPFLLQKGTWIMRHFEPIDHPPLDKCFLNYGEKHREDVVIPIDEGINEFFINSPVAKDSQEQVEVLQFKRVEDTKLDGN